MDDAALVAVDVVEGQGGAVLIGVDDLAVGHQTQLDQRLEAVADTQHQTVAVVQMGGDLFLDLGVAEEGGDELGGAVGLVAAGEAAGDLVTMRCEAFPMLAVWANPSGSFICLEPWFGRADDEGFAGTIDQKKEIQVLNAGAKQEIAYSIEFHR